MYKSIIQKLLNRGQLYGFFGDYKSWEEAEAASTGYDSELIFKSVFKSALAVKKVKPFLKEIR